MHKEIGLENDTNETYARVLVIGPKFDEYYMKVAINRMTMLCMFQLSFLETLFKVKVSDNSIYEEAKNTILSNSKQ